MKTSAMTASTLCETQVDLMLQTVAAFRRGDAAASLPREWPGPAGLLAAEINALMDDASKVVEGVRQIRAGAGTPPVVRYDSVGGFWGEIVVLAREHAADAQKTLSHSNALLQALTAL